MRNSNQKANSKHGKRDVPFFFSANHIFTCKRIFIQYNANGWCNMLEIYSIIQSFICIIHWTHAHISWADAMLLLRMLLLLFFFSCLIRNWNRNTHKVNAKKLKKKSTNAIGFAQNECGRNENQGQRRCLVSWCLKWCEYVCVCISVYISLFFVQWKVNI